MGRDRGWLKPDALRTAGVKEQHAVGIGPATHVIELEWNKAESAYDVVHVVRLPCRPDYTRLLFTGDLVLARRAFREEVRGLGGRA